MSHGEKCPICNGDGKIKDPNYARSTAPVKKPCHGCGGSGWITIKD